MPRYDCDEYQMSMSNSINVTSVLSVHVLLKLRQVEHAYKLVVDMLVRWKGRGPSVDRAMVIKSEHKQLLRQKKPSQLHWDSFGAPGPSI